MVLTIREAVPRDAPALLALERAAPEGGFFTVGVEPHVDHFTIAARYPNSRGYVAQIDERVVGTVFASVAPTQLNSAVVPGAYLSALRVHPDYQRRGIATTLLTHAWEQTRKQDGVEVAWGIATSRNQASIRACHRAGFTQERELIGRVLLPLPGPAPRAGLVWRYAVASDVPQFAAALNERYAGYQLWRPCNEAELARSSILLAPSAEHTLVGDNQRGEIIAGATVLAFYRFATLHIQGLRMLPAPLNRVLSPIFGRIPERTVLIRRPLLPTGNRVVVQALLHRAARTFGFGIVPILVVDPRDPSWPAVKQYPGVSLSLRALARSERQIADDRPWQVD